MFGWQFQLGGEKRLFNPKVRAAPVCMLAAWLFSLRQVASCLLVNMLLLFSQFIDREFNPIVKSASPYPLGCGAGRLEKNKKKLIQKSSSQRRGVYPSLYPALEVTPLA